MRFRNCLLVARHAWSGAISSLGAHMNSSFLPQLLLAAMVISGVAISQTDIIHYPFLKGSGTSVKNLASAGPSTGTIVSQLPNAWTTGKIDNALRGSNNTSSTSSNYVDTRWKPVIKNDFTVAWFQKQRVAPGTGLSYVFSGVGSFRCFTNGVAIRGLWCREWGGAPADLKMKMTTDIQALSIGRWVHVALVVDWTSTKTATWYVNGFLDATIALAAGANVNGTSTMRIGQHSSRTSSFAYDIDDFRFSTRAASPGEIAAWATQWATGKGAGGNSYNASPFCTAQLGSTRVPYLGNVNYSLTLDANKLSSPFILSIGISRTTIAFDLGLVFASMRGCQFGSSLDILLVGNTGHGFALIPLPIPNLAALKDVNLWNQVVVLVNEQASNGYNMFLR